ncbi:dTDP-4-dehydrorhamnose reductase [Acidocella sp.]|uniref:dTDP-4-dehydrorhamnose reductase n=1 Tax=Acidocella sp. TaxID=50710 RepID=UPI002639E251|nr:dTDP-4-dehydrorhamnose reductase [Acidocella sp.]
MILVIGTSGQLGNALAHRLSVRDETFTAAGRPGFDFEKPETIVTCFEATKPSLVINAAAYTAVDKAETDLKAAKAGNHTGPLALAKLCEAADVPFIHVSTDYVFDGNKGAPYLETDPTGPTGVYGTTKRDGEAAILATNAKAIILRTAWVYSAWGKNFARTMINAGRKMHILRVVADQRGTPTAAGDLADAILAIIDKIRTTGWQPEYRGIFHATSRGETTWHDFAVAIFEEAAKHGYPAPQLQPIATADWPTPTRRPPDSRLDSGKLARVFGVRLPEWKSALPDIIANLMTQDETAKMQ